MTQMATSFIVLGTLVVFDRTAMPMPSSALAISGSVYIQPLKGPGKPPFDRVPTPLSESVIEVKTFFISGFNEFRVRYSNLGKSFVSKFIESHMLMFNG